MGESQGKKGRGGGDEGEKDEDRERQGEIKGESVGRGERQTWGGGEGRSIEVLRQGRRWTDTHRATGRFSVIAEKNYLDSHVKERGESFSTRTQTWVGYHLPLTP